MRYIKHILAMAGLVAMLLPGTASAVGTAAGTVIANQATATYGIGTTTGLTTRSNTATVTVQQVTDVVVTQINSPIIVTPGDTGVAAIFRVTNTGNGPDTFDLVPNSTIAGDQFDPVLSTPNSIAIDSNGNGVYDPGTDAYATVTPTLAADAYTTVFVFNDIPTGVADTYTGLTEVTATSKRASGTPGTVVTGGGVGGVNAIAGGNGGSGSARATYRVSSVVVDVAKSSSIIADPYTAAPGPYQAIPGATIQYTLTVTVTGGGTANNLVITDPIPANTTYKAGTITLNGTALTDAVDADAGSYDAATNTVQVNLGNVAGGSAAQTITFDVTIN